MLNDILTRTSPVDSDFGWARGRPIDRYYIENFLRAHSHLIRGCVLEVADHSYIDKFGQDKVEKFDVLHIDGSSPETTLIADLTNPRSLPEDVFDCFICTQTLHVIFDVHAAIQGAYRVLKPGGVLLATLPGISQIAEWDIRHWGDNWRFTTLSVEKLFKPIFTNRVEIEAFGNVMAAIALLHGLAVEDLPDPQLLDVRDNNYQVVITVAATK